MTFTSLQNHFLIATPSLRDPYFFRTVIYLCTHTEQGAMGLIINQPLLQITLGNLLEQMGIVAKSPEITNRMLFSGGPIQTNQGFILHTDKSVWQSTLVISDAISLTTSPDILQAIAHQEGPIDSLVALGITNWQEGQLEKELYQNYWLYSPVNLDILFHSENQSKWRAAAAFAGIDLDRLSEDIGHA